MTDFLQNHQKLATAIAILIAASVVVFLFIISGNNPAPSAGDSAYQPVVAHGQAGPVVKGGEAASTPGIRQVDYQALLGVDLSGGETLDEGIFLDINADGAEEALLIVRAAGDSHPIDWFLFGMRDGAPQKLFERTRVARGEVAVQGSMLVESEGVYGAGDPECCPSSSKRTFYVWKGAGLVVSRIEAVPPGAVS